MSVEKAALALRDGAAVSHTAAPWRVHVEIDGYPAGRLTRVFGDRGQQVASTYNQTRPHLQEALARAEANARLIAAAPELLAALKELRLTYGVAVSDEYGTDPLLVAVDAVITKAEGRTQ